MAPVTVLVYREDDPERWAALVRAPRGRVRVRTAATPAAAEAVIDEVDVLFAWNFPPALYRRARRLRWVQVMGAGVDAALVPELPAHVVVTRAPGVFGPWMAEYVLAWCLWRTQRVERYRAAQRARRWLADVVPERLGGRTLVLVGLGDIGRVIARTARALGLRVLGVSRSGRPVPHVERVYPVRALARAFREADWAVLVLPLTPETRGLVDARALAALPPHAWLVNVGRGAVVDEAALVRALEAGRLGGAILDVFAREPLPPDSPLWGFENVVVTPHVAGPDVPEAVTAVFNENLARFLAGRRPRHAVDRARGY